MRAAGAIARLACHLQAQLVPRVVAVASEQQKIGAGAALAGSTNEVVPPGQAGASNGNSFVRALLATGIISSIVATPTSVTVSFDLSKPSSK
ncbi:MAG TPA: hypothetical protein VGR87_03560 [Candidatus Limnocylindria bacterium]|jgi:hypothetical protein|nr:hypothetical protein [Candidatus Limnocylindria bacterium]